MNVRAYLFGLFCEKACARAMRMAISYRDDVKSKAHATDAWRVAERADKCAKFAQCAANISGTGRSRAMARRAQQAAVDAEYFADEIFYKDSVCDYRKTAR